MGLIISGPISMGSRSPTPLLFLRTAPNGSHLHSLKNCIDLLSPSNAKIPDTSLRSIEELRKSVLHSRIVLMSSGKRATGDASASEYNVEFRAYNDDAWYSVRVLLEGEVLRVKYQDFPEEHDNVFNVNMFKSVEELKEFKERFRSLSDQLQDHECHKIVEGMKVCACHSYSPDDVRYYDAVVEAVEVSKHSIEKGEECLCKFIVHWLHGPIAGTLNVTNVANICMVRPNLELDPTVASFLKMARERFEITSSDSNSICKGVTGREVGKHCGENTKSSRKLGFFERLRKETRCARRSASKISPTLSEERVINCHDKTLEDRDLGGRKHFMMLIGNLDKTLSPPTIAEFLHNQTEVLPTVYIYPSLSGEIFTRGAIVLDCERDFQKLCDFLHNPDHIIMSSTGRPWVIIEKLVGLDNIEASIGTLMPLSRNILQRGSSGRTDSLKVVCSGTPEFKIADKLRTLFVEFHAHQEGLHKRLAFEEGRILCM